MKTHSIVGLSLAAAVLNVATEAIKLDTLEEVVTSEILEALPESEENLVAQLKEAAALEADNRKAQFIAEA